MIAQELDNPIGQVLTEIAALREMMKRNHDYPMTREEAADYLKVKPRRIDVLRRAGQLSYVTLAGADEQDRTIRFLKSDLDAMMKRNRRQALQ